MQQLMKIARSIVAALIFVGVAAVEVSAQLAITEVFAASSNNLLPDYWELTNFGSDDLNLDGYGFQDGDPADFATYPFEKLVIRAHESIIFVRTNKSSAVHTIEAFKASWGETNLPEDLQIRFWLTGGLDGDNGDKVWLFNSNQVVVAMVEFDKSVPGRSFTYSPENGEFGVLSIPDFGHAFRAAMVTNDVGSPGWTSGQTPLLVHGAPTNQTLTLCSRAAFSIAASGIPPPRYQWTRNGIPIPGETAATFVISAVDLSDTGEYSVILDNGLTNLMSAAGILTVSTNPKPPVVVRSLHDVSVFPGQIAEFEIETQGYPCPLYQWRSNGVVIAGATSRTLSVSVPMDASESSNHYSVTVWNEVGSTNVSAMLVVSRRPRLVITEIMSFPTDGFLLSHENWFELTNYDTNAVFLQGYRFKDSTNLSVASMVTNAVSIQPGESIVFVEAMSAAEFKQWWGPANLPPDLQIITWGGWGLSTVTITDHIRIWNPAAIDNDDTVAIESRLNAISGFSQLSFDDYCDSTFGCQSGFGSHSVEGERGAFRAAEGGDIGSPGYAAFPRVLGISKSGLNVSVRCLVEPGSTYQLLASDHLSGAPWTPVASVTANTNWVITIPDTVTAAMEQRFYRIMKLP